MSIAMSLDSKTLEYLAAVAKWLESAPKAPDFDVYGGPVKVTQYANPIGYFVDEDGWWDFHEGEPKT